MNHTVRWAVLAISLSGSLMLGGCKKKAAPAPPPPPPPPPAPTASLSANPGTIQRGQSSTLTWHTENAMDVTIDSLGNVSANGSRSITPSESTTYQLTAKGAGGTAQASTRVTVTQPPPPPSPPPPSPSEKDLFNQNINDIFFDFDKSNIRIDQQSAMRADAQFLTQHPSVQFIIEGHCDERGSIEYNLALGDKRAHAAKQALVDAGVAAGNIQTISYGKEKPFCTEHNETCWQQNRRAHFIYQR
jgi:peptidoglycan-associated lipoprotein